MTVNNCSDTRLCGLYITKCQVLYSKLGMLNYTKMNCVRGSNPTLTKKRIGQPTLNPNSTLTITFSYTRSVT